MKMLRNKFFYLLLFTAVSFTCAYAASTVQMNGLQAWYALASGVFGMVAVFAGLGIIVE